MRRLILTFTNNDPYLDFRYATPPQQVKVGDRLNIALKVDAVLIDTVLIDKRINTSFNF